MPYTSVRTFREIFILMGSVQFIISSVTVWFNAMRRRPIYIVLAMQPYIAIRIRNRVMLIIILKLQICVPYNQVLLYLGSPTCTRASVIFVRTVTSCLVYISG